MFVRVGRFFLKNYQKIKLNKIVSKNLQKRQKKVAQDPCVCG